MPYSYQQTVAAGGSDLVSVPFPYILKAHVALYLDGVLQVGYSWLNDTTIQATGVIPAGTVQLVRRTTPAGDPAVVFVKGQFDESDMNLSEKQSLYIDQEHADHLADLDAEQAVQDGILADHESRLGAVEPTVASLVVSQAAQDAILADHAGRLGDIEPVLSDVSTRAVRVPVGETGLVTPDVASRSSKWAAYGLTGAMIAVGSPLAVIAEPANFSSRMAAVGAPIPIIQTFFTTGGYYEAGDGGGATYKVEVSEPAVPAPCKVELAGGLWGVLAEQRFDFRMFGGKVDGVESTAAMQAALTFLQGRELYVSAGRVRLTGATATGAVTLPAAGCNITGAGKYASVIEVDGAADCAMFVGVDADRISFNNIGFDGQATTRVAWQRALVLRGVEDVSLTGCWFHRIGDGGVLFGREGFGGSDAYGEGTRQPKRIQVQGCDWSDCRGTVALLSKYTGMSDVQIIGNRFTNSCSIAISIESEDGGADPSLRTLVANNLITGCSYLFTGGLSPIAYGISLGELVEGVVCQGNVIDGVVGDTLAAGILVSTSPSQTDTLTQRMLVSANTVTDITGVTGRGYGVLVQAGDTSVDSLALLGNVIWECEVGIGFEPDAGAKTLGYIRGIVCQGNVIENCTEFGIWSNTLSSSGALPLLDAVISGNTVRGCGSHGISVKMQRGTLAGNISSSNTGIGIGLVSGSSNVLVNANTSVFNGGDGMQLNGDDLQVTCNRSRNNGQAGATSYGIYVLSGARAEIIANDSGDDQGSPTQDWGIRAPNGSTVRNNKLIGNASGTIFNGIGVHNTGTYDAGLNRTA